MYWMEWSQRRWRALCKPEALIWHFDLEIEMSSGSSKVARYQDVYIPHTKS
jgi:hypothetical protein